MVLSKKCDFQVCLIPPSFTPVWPEFLMSSFKESFEVESFKEMVGLEIFANDTILKQVDNRVFRTKEIFLGTVLYYNNWISMGG